MTPAIFVNAAALPQAIAAGDHLLANCLHRAAGVVVADRQSVFAWPPIRTLSVRPNPPLVRVIVPRRPDAKQSRAGFGEDLIGKCTRKNTVVELLDARTDCFQLERRNSTSSFITRFSLQTRASSPLRGLFVEAVGLPWQ